MKQLPNDSTPGVVPWPDPIDEAGRYGLAGEFVSLVAPYTEADPNAILLCFLVYCGNCMGRNFFVSAGADQHFGNLFLCLVGATGHGRKGSAMSVVEAFFPFKGGIPRMGHRLKGISTGESIVYEVHDDIYRNTLNKKTGEYERILAEPNEPEKRILYQLSEFQQCLAGMKKPDASLPSILRTAWDKGDLATPAKTSRSIATGAHVSIVCGMSREELLAETSAKDAESGTLNRFLFGCCRRSKLLPQATRFQDLCKSEMWKSLQERLARNIDTMEEQVHMQRDDDAEARWGLNESKGGVYRALNVPRIGVWGAITARAAQMVLRIALITSAINGPSEREKQKVRDQYLIKPADLEAAIEIWRYCDDSCKFIWGDRMDDPTAVEIMAQLRKVQPLGLRKDDLGALVTSSNGRRSDFNRALIWLSHSGIARVEKIGGKGRPAEMWYAT